MKSITEAQAKDMRALTQRASIRAERKQFLVEGPHLLEAALEHAPHLLVQIAMTAHAAERYPHLLDRCNTVACYSMSEKLAARASDTEESQGVFAVLRTPEPEEDASGDIAIALDGVQDPGNVGTIIRTAAWFGVKSVLLGQGTADPFAPKVVRATQGAIFSDRKSVV